MSMNTLLAMGIVGVFSYWVWLLKHRLADANGANAAPHDLTAGVGGLAPEPPPRVGHVHVCASGRHAREEHAPRHPPASSTGRLNRRDDGVSVWAIE